LGSSTKIKNIIDLTLKDSKVDPDSFFKDASKINKSGQPIKLINQKNQTLSVSNEATNNPTSNSFLQSHPSSLSSAEGIVPLTNLSQTNAED
jgi:hypothetical protein